MEILEKELEDYLYSLDENNNPIGIYGECFRQVKIGAYGIADLLYIDIDTEDGIPSPLPPEITITIVELKKGYIDLSALGQLGRYMKGLRHYISNLQDEARHKDKFKIKIHGVLVGEGFGEGDICYIAEYLENISCWDYSLDIEKGISFEPSGRWFKTDESFNGLDILKKTVTTNYMNIYKEKRREWRDFKDKGG